ncbi:MAG TPA: UDP-N-acetylglucosamine 2-epimerase (non-hydrolyzing) [Saprospiraceae bacterium]|nr:UDP-N-acetylglucosamine 2-epimerase (non-hydrolyzing) [Saprospiraceae bacterium]
MKKILTIVGARPNFMKAAVLHRALEALPGVVSRIVHTGQHYDPAMSGVFFRELDLPAPHEYLDIHDAHSIRLVARIMLALEPVLERERPDWVVVIGDVDSTLAAALTAHKMGIPLAHVEAGLRSFDRGMPEENNRIVTDALSDLLFVTEPQGVENLLKEGVPAQKIHTVGNCLVDCLVQFHEKARQTEHFERLQLPDGKYALLTFHRPSNVDTAPALERLVDLIEQVCLRYPAVFPLHPRTRNRLEQAGLLERLSQNPRLHMPEPLGYLPFLNLMEHAAVVVTDSGGVQVESGWLDVPCITLRNSTESPACVAFGTNVLLPEFDAAALNGLLDQIEQGGWKKSRLRTLWDGQAAVRMAEILVARPSGRREEAIHGRPA